VYERTRLAARPVFVWRPDGIAARLSVAPGRRRRSIVPPFPLVGAVAGGADG
jgi:hypothetical protein